MSRHWTCDIDGLVQPIVAESGPASYPPKTIVESFLKVVELHGDENALGFKV